MRSSVVYYFKFALISCSGQAAQEQQTQAFNNKLENATKNLTKMIDNVATGEGIKSSKYITRSAIAKSIMLNAIKITKALTEQDKTSTKASINGHRLHNK
jgi:hypothetical protein